MIKTKTSSNSSCSFFAYPLQPVAKNSLLGDSMQKVCCQNELWLDLMARDNWFLAVSVVGGWRSSQSCCSSQSLKCPKFHHVQLVSKICGKCVTIDWKHPKYDEKNIHWRILSLRMYSSLNALNVFCTLQA